MAQTIDCPALDEIEIFLSLLIGQLGAAPFDEHDGRTFADLHQGRECVFGDARRGRDVRFEHVVLLRCVATDGGPKAQGPRRCRQGPS